MKAPMRVGPILLVAAYILVWFVCACLYQREANRFGGRSFHYAEDLKYQRQAQMFQSASSLEVGDHLAIELVRGASDLREVVAIGEPPKFYARNEIGPKWGEYYQRLMLSQGISHWTIVARKREAYPVDEVDSVLMRPGNRSLISPGDHTRWKATFAFFKAHDLGRRESQTDLQRLGSKQSFADVWFDEDPLVLFSKTGWADSERIVTAKVLHLVLSKAVSYLDDAPQKLKNVLEGKHQYPLLPFLYFSAVTITTVGYGDILPNSNDMRLLVMIEAFLGLILIGAFVSSMFSQPTIPQPHLSRPGRDRQVGSEDVDARSCTLRS